MGTEYKCIDNFVTVRSDSSAMILNPTHTITLSGLPPDVLDAYVRYKKGSRAIVAWLIQYGPLEYQDSRPKTLPIKELAVLARSVAKQIKEIPDVIHFHFRETIAARNRLSRFFRTNVDASEDEFDTVNHEHFTSSLKSIYNELRTQCQHTIKRKSSSSPQDQSRQMQSSFNYLSVEDMEGEDEYEDWTPPNCDECRQVNPPVCSAEDSCVSFEDDEMSTVIETVVLVERMRQVFNTTAEIWSGVGRHQVSYIAAAASTNAAGRRLRDLHHELKTISSHVTLDSLHRVCCIFEEKRLPDEDATQTPQHSLIRELDIAHRSVKHYVDGHKLLKIPACATCVQKPLEYLQAPSSSQAEGRLYMALLDNMLHLVHTVRGAPSLVLTSSPCFTELSHVISNIRNPQDDLEFVLVLHLMHVSYVSCLQNLSMPAEIAFPRISILKLASHSSAMIATALSDKSVFPCQCSHTLGNHLSNLQHDLTAFAKYKCWDLYFQSPWVAGCHTIEVLDRLSYYGMRLFHYRHYIGAILHTYNILKQLASLEPIPLLEELCIIFQQTFFPSGSNPTTSFKNHWSRFVGARLKFRKGHNHRDRSFCMAIPAHEGKNAAGWSEGGQAKLDPKFDYGRLSPLIRLKQHGYVVSTDFRTNAVLSPASPIKDVSTKPRRDSGIDMPDDGVDSVIDIIESSVNAGHATSDTIPTTRFNHLAVFLTCVKMIQKITSEIHTKPEEKADVSCICFATTILQGADRISEGRRLGRLECWKKGEREVVDSVKNVLKDVMSLVKMEDWLWDV